MLIEKQYEMTNIPLNEDAIMKTLRLVNRAISDDLIRAWIKKVRGNLECEQRDRR